MEIYTLTAARKIAKEVKTIAYIFPIIFNALYLCFVAWSLITQRGVMWINIVLAVLCAVNILCCVIPVKSDDKRGKAAKKIVKRSGKAIKLIVCTVTLIGTVYSIYMATTSVAPITLISATISILAWILQLVLFVASWAVERWVDMLKSGFDADRAQAEPLINGIKAVKNTVVSTTDRVKGLLGFFGRRDDDPPTDE